MEENAATFSDAGTVAVEAPPLPASLDLNELQTLTPAELDTLCQEFNVRVHPGRTRHQQIADLVRQALPRGTRVHVSGFLDQVTETFGVLRFPALNFLPVPEDVGVPRALVQRFRLRPGQQLAGTLRLPRDREKLIMLDEVTEIEGAPAAEWREPTAFDNLTPLFPDGRILLENSETNSISARAVDLLTPLGRGQRGLIVAAPRVGKTILLKEIAKAIRVNHPEIVLIILLVDERPEEVTDLQREVDCEIYNSTFDENCQRHVQVAELVLERAKRLVELKKDVVVLLDSITRLARGYN
ncbi:MAG: transcription termination factor Rho, partial [Chthoniobacterales bacterium]|nr:transcription termination factor Rho [Chthoniobacterales bacterium]